MIELTELTKVYGRQTVLNGVSLRIERGGLTSIIGPNGAGKSTMLTIIGRLLRADGGQVTVDGLDVARAPGRVMAQRMSILRQENRFTTRLTVRDLVSFGRYPHSQGHLTPTDRSQIEAALGFLDLGPLAERYLDELSGGQRQRAYVAMVLCQDTEYVLLDEPLNNLDMKHAVAMMRQIRRAADTLGKTVVLVVHDINFASAYSDRIIAMRDGEIAHAGPPEAIMTPEILRDVFDLDVQVTEIGGSRIGVYY
ncbi:ATP-binding cassette domain-containing protein [Lipingzhangella sp. LS1_29]|uniref:ATP-binding cassette domain-containing protein n=1 Tax=Lipingzhangella rawalii TaxID=2055835 RepID=A0ABU2H876_9ACTN|nr:ATP-binding cassette domain-containing protein [Lipingzhangella rawalii]MDS1271040.1 ATP-binding cassette domain-containing protein [Lipingzhangella rawalii]